MWAAKVRALALRSETSRRKIGLGSVPPENRASRLSQGCFVHPGGAWPEEVAEPVESGVGAAQPASRRMTARATKACKANAKRSGS